MQIIEPILSFALAGEEEGRGAFVGCGCVCGGAYLQAPGHAHLVVSFVV